MIRLFFASFLAAGLMASANAASHVNARGYETCENQLATEFKAAGPTFARTYFVERKEDARVFYINAYVWAANREREAVRATCTTTENGREVTAIETDMGSYVRHQGGLATIQ